MRTKPYDGEKIIHELQNATWWGPSDIFLEYGQLYVTNKRIIFENIKSDRRSRECIIYLDEAKSFSYQLRGWLSPPYLFVTKENGTEEKFGISNTDITSQLLNLRECYITEKAKNCEQHLDYVKAISLWDKLGKPEEAARVRKLMAEQGSVKVDQTVVHGDYVDDRDTIVKDSVISKSSIGAGGSSKMQELEKLTEMKKEGLINDDEFKQMKKEILGK